jgi:hypothetical protein
MFSNLERHVADVNWNAEKGWTKEHTSAAIYLGITGLLVLAKNYLGVIPDGDGEGNEEFAKGFREGSRRSEEEGKGKSEVNEGRLGRGGKR